MFHWRDNLFFGRCVDGAVRVLKFDAPKGMAAVRIKGDDGYMKISDFPDAEGTVASVNVLLDVRIPPDEWASIISSVAAMGEASGGYQAAKDFHSREKP